MFEFLHVITQEACNGKWGELLIYFTSYYPQTLWKMGFEYMYNIKEGSWDEDHLKTSSSVLSPKNHTVRLWNLFIALTSLSTFSIQMFRVSEVNPETDLRMTEIMWNIVKHCGTKIVKWF